MVNPIIRIFDIFISILMLIIFSPIMVIVSIFVFVLNGRPIIYRQYRVGLNGKKFFILKYRTMSEVIVKNDKLRLTVLGKILRRTSLDELPQLFNVLKKDMSIVGPRPLPENIEKKIKSSFKKKRRKLLPGLTGMSQINFTGKKRKLTDKVKLDLWFVDNYNLYNYFKILIITPFILIIRFLRNKSSIIK